MAHKPGDPRGTARWRRVRLLVLDRDGWLCQLRLDNRCAGRADTVDHLDSVTLTTTDPYDASRLVAACRHCNSVKGQSSTSRRVIGRAKW